MTEQQKLAADAVKTVTGHLSDLVQALRDENAKLRAERDALARAVADAEVVLAGRGLTDRATPEEKAAMDRFRNRGKAPTP